MSTSTLYTTLRTLWDEDGASQSGALLQQQASVLLAHFTVLQNMPIVPEETIEELRKLS